jgi:hypothetical protein
LGCRVKEGGVYLGESVGWVEQSETRQRPIFLFFKQGMCGLEH